MATATSITPSWASGSGGLVATYNLRWRPQGGSTWTVITGIVSSQVTITGLASGTNYEWQVQAVNDGGTSAYSSSYYCATLSSAVSMAELFFTPTSSFVDLTVQANRRAFISSQGGAVAMSSSVGWPFSTQPAVFLSSNGTPSSFAVNNGKGGGFSNGGSLVASSTNPPGASTTTTIPSSGQVGNGVLGDYLTGNLYAFDPNTLTDNGTPRRWLRRWRALPENNNAAKRFSALTIDMQTGISVPPASTPHVMLRWSDDGGKTWSDQRILALGVLGDTIRQPKFNRLGTTRRYGASDRIFELSSSDIFPVQITNADADVS